MVLGTDLWPKFSHNVIPFLNSGEIDRLQNTTENLEDNIIDLDIENNETKGLL